MKSDDKTKVQMFFHKIKVMFKNIWKLIKKLFIKLFNLIKDNKIAKIVLASLVALIIIIYGIIIAAGGPTSAVRTYSKGLVDSNAKKMYSVVNSKYVKEVESSSNIVVLESIEASLSSLKQINKDYLSYKIIDSYDLGSYEKEQLIETMKLYAKDLDESKIKGAKRYLVKFKINVQGNTTYVYTSIYSVKRGLTWSVVYNA
ncbi:MAG: hypothetical protein K6E99_05940 [Bacilli bacterium]|nr:hypothetical protein [Bacilli bacterium]